MNLHLPAGTITIVGKKVSRLGFGTMHLTGPGTWGDPHDRDRAVSVLHQAVHTDRASTTLSAPYGHATPAVSLSAPSATAEHIRRFGLLTVQSFR